MYTAILLHFDGPKGSTTFTDATGRHTGAANGGVQIDTAVSQWGNASLLVDGNAGSYASFTGNLSDFNLTGDFTIEFTVCPLSYGASGFICFHSDPSVVLTNRYWVQVDTSGIAHWAINGVFVIDSTATVPLNAKTHIAVSRTGSTTQLFINGISQGSLAGTDNLAIGTAFIIGARGDGTVFNLNGYLDEFRVVNGYGVYTSNFQVPAGPFSPDITQLRPPFYAYYRPLDTLQRSWAWSNVLLIGKDKLPTGDQFFDLSPIAPPQILPRSWAWNYNLNLIGQDLLPAGDQRFELTPKGYEYPISLRSWASYTLPLLAPVTQNPFYYQYHYALPVARPITIDQTWTVNLLLSTLVQPSTIAQVFDLPPRAHPEPRVRIWTWSYNLNLIGQDLLPAGARIYDTPAGPLYPTQLRSWISYLTPLLAQVVQNPFYYQIYYQLPPQGYPEPATRTWAWNYNLNLISKDQMLVGEQVYDLTPIAQPQILPRSWTLNLQQTTLQPIPYGDQWYDRTPLGPIQPLREWTGWYNLNLIGQDSMLIGKQVSDLAPVGYIYPAQLRTWIDKPILPLYTFVASLLPIRRIETALPLAPLQPDRAFTFSWPRVLIGQDQMVTGKQAYDLPPRPYAEPATRTWAWSFFWALVQLPPGNRVYDLVPRDDRPTQLRSYTASYNLNLIGQDQLPAGDQYYELSPRDHLRLLQLRVWYERYNLNLIGKDKLPPGDQYYEFPRPPLQPTSIFVASYNKNLIGKDQLPAGDQYFDLSPRGPITPRDVINWISSVNLALNFPAPPPVLLPPGALVYDLVPTDRRYSNFRDFVSGCNLCIGIPVTPPTPPPVPVGPQFVHNPGNEWQIYDRIREPGPLGWR